MTLDHDERKEIRQVIKESDDMQNAYLLEKINGYARTHKKNYELIKEHISEIKEDEKELKELIQKLYVQTVENGSQITILNSKNEISINKAIEIQAECREKIYESKQEIKQLNNTIDLLKEDLAPWHYISKKGQKISRFWIFVVVFVVSSFTGIVYLLNNWDKITKIIPIL